MNWDTPPTHPNCRCVLVPLRWYQRWWYSVLRFWHKRGGGISWGSTKTELQKHLAVEIRPWHWTLRAFPGKHPSTHHVVIIGAFCYAWPTERTRMLYRD